MEKSIQELAGSVGTQRKGGEIVRLIDVPLLSKSIFDRAEAKGTDVTPEFKAAMFEALASASNENCGIVFTRYLTKVCSQPKTTKKRVKASISYFVKKVARSDDGDMARDVARKFGLLYAGGNLARRHKLVPWTQQDLLQAVSDCYNAARDLLPDDGVIVRQGRTLIKTALEALESRGKIKQFGAVDGYRDPKQTYSFVIAVEKFNSIFASKHQRELVLASLSKSKRIVMDKPKKKGSRSSPQAQFIWPDGKRRRSCARGRLVIERIAGKDFTTLRHIERMRELCRVEAKEQGSGFARSDEARLASVVMPQPGSFSTVTSTSAQAALRTKLQQRRKNLRPTSRQTISPTAKSETSSE
jgi:hypothetical protein